MLSWKVLCETVCPTRTGKVLGWPEGTDGSVGQGVTLICSQGKEGSVSVKHIISSTF